jgi:uncharacterized protein YuzE
MKHRYLEITYRRGKAIAAYLYLPRQLGAKSVRTEDAGNGLRVDYDANGNAMGIEVTAPGQVPVDNVNSVLARLGAPAIQDDEWAPLRAA